ncbi:MAG TPA: glycoside hydrolase family 125 protein [Phycisphaerae bacterium]|nr:glycoside hydrolase family 125 protein [Phycisphaerae bacterium]
MHPTRRPPAEKRSFTSPVIERVLAETRARIADPVLAWLFENCFPNTLDTTVTFTDSGGGVPDTFIITGDIDAMWLRDSTNQVWPYLPFARECPRLRALLRGLIARQARCVLLDPYANAFYKDATRESQWKSDHTEMKPGVHERKYELDSLASVLRLAAGFVEATGDTAALDKNFLAAVEKILDTIQNEQAGTPEQIHPWYSFARTTANATDTLPNGAHGNPVKRTGMSRSPFRPSDDSAILQYHIPANAMAAVALRKMATLLQRLAPALSTRSLSLASEITTAINTHGIAQARTKEKIYAYEVDGFGSHVLMDDAGPPSLLALPYLGFCTPQEPLYAATRRFILSNANPYYHRGTAASGVGSPHVGMGWIWPLSIITQALTSTDDAEILLCLNALKSTHAGTGFMHEAFWMNDPKRYTRDWFAWANTFFGELILHLAHTRPDLLQCPLA